MLKRQKLQFLISTAASSILMFRTSGNGMKTVTWSHSLDHETWLSIYTMSVSRGGHMSGPGAAARLQNLKGVA